MSVTTTTHLNFRGRAKEALEFYQSVFGGELSLVTFGQANRPQDDPAEAGLIIWGHVLSEAGVHVMAFDVPARMPYDQGENAVFVAVSGTDPEEITAYWKGLTAGGEIQEDLGPAGWSSLYGKVRDRFGVVWVLDVAAS